MDAWQIDSNEEKKKRRRRKKRRKPKNIWNKNEA